MKKRILLLTALLTFAIIPLSACGQSDTTERNRIKIEEQKTPNPTEVPPTPETSPEACPDLEDCPEDDCPEQDLPENPDSQPPEFVKPPEFRRDFRDRMPKRIKTFGFVLVMPSPTTPSTETKIPSPDDNHEKLQENN